MKTSANIAQRRPNETLLSSAFFLFIIGVTAFSDSSNTLILFYISAIVYAAAVVLHGFSQPKMVVPSNAFIGVFFLLVVWLALSTLWQFSSAFYTSRLTTLVIVFVFVVLTSTWITDMRSLETAYLSIVYANVFNAVYRLLLHYFWNSLTTDITGKNTTAVQMVITYALALYLFYRLSQKRFLYCAALFALTSLLTASRKSVFGLLIVTVMMILLNTNNRKRFISVLVFIAVIIIGWIIISKTEVFSFTYKRLMEFWEHLHGEDGDHSSEIRGMMREIGWEAFREKPLLGYGVGYSSTKLTATFLKTGTYLHNNFVELGVSLGSIGLLLYYLPFARCLLRSLFSLRKDIGYLLISTILIVLTVLDYGMVSYFDKFTLLLLNIIAIHTRILQKGASTNGAEG